MELLAGTARGVFRVGDGQCLLHSGTVRDLVAINGTLFAGTDAGLYRSRNNGASWDLIGFGDIAIWQIRAHNGRIWVGTAPAGLYVSDDDGDTWQMNAAFSRHPDRESWGIPLDPPLPGRARAIAINRDNPDQMLVGVEVGGIMRTVDGGASWSLILPGGNPDLHMIFQHPGAANIVFASTGYGRADHIAEMVEGNAGVLRSDDFGATWTYCWQGITPRYARPMCIDHRGLTVASAPTAFSHHREEGGAQAMLYRSDDQGGSWRSLGDEAHSPSAANFHGLISHPDCPGDVLVGTDTGEVWHVTGDAGWHLQGDGLPPVMGVLGV